MGHNESLHVDGTSADLGMPQRLRKISSVLCLCTIAFGGCVMLGWWLHIPFLKGFNPGGVTVKGNTGLCFVLLGLGLWLEGQSQRRPLWRSIVAMACLLVCVIGSISLAEYLTGWNSGIDNLLFRAGPEDSLGSTRPNLMSALTAVSFVALALAILINDLGKRRCFWCSQLLVCVVAVAALFGVLDIVLDPKVSHTHMAPGTAVALLAFAAAVLFSRPERGLGALLAARTSGGTLVRRLLPAAILVPLVAGYLHWRLDTAEVFSPWMGVSVTIVNVAAVLAILSVWTAYLLDKIDHARMLAQEHIARLASIVTYSSEAIIGKTLDGTVVSWNPAAESMYGYSAQEMIGRSISTIVPPDRMQEFEGLLERLRRGEQIRHFESERIRKGGEHIQVSVAVAPIRDSAGNLVGASTVARDITDEKQAERKLRQQATLLELANDAIILRDSEDRVIYWNHGAERTYGYSSAQALGRVTHELLQTDFPAPLSDIEAHIRTEKAWEGELAHRTSKGTHVTVASRWSVICDDDGVPVAILEINRDITERKHAEAALLAEREKFNTILDSVPPYVCLLTPDYHLAFANHEFKRRFGEAPGLHCYEALFNRTEPCEICETYKVLEDGQSRRWEWTGPDGRNYDVYDLPFTDTDGSKLILEMGMDVTERRQAEAAVRASETHFRRLFETAKDGILMIDADTEQITDVNEFLREMLGYPSSEIVGKKLWEIGPLKDVQACRTCFANLQDQEYIRYDDLPLETKDGRSLSVEFISNVYEVDGKKVVQCNIRDITERKRAQAAVKLERQRFEAVLESLPALICLLTPDHEVAFANKAFRDRFGEAKGRKCYDYVLGNSSPCSFCEAFRVLDTHVPHDWECTTPQGRVLHTYNMPFTDVDGSPLVLEMNIDVTDQRRTEEALRKSMAELEEAQRVATLGSWTLDLKTGEVKWSGELYKMLGLDPSQPAVAYSKQEQIFAPESWARLTAHVDETRRSGIPYELELQTVRSDGSHGWMWARGEPVRDANGTIAALRGVAQDITGRKEAELALRESEQKFSTLADFVPQFVWMCTPDGLNFYFNQRWFDYTGLSPEESHGTGWNTPFHPDDKQAAWDAWNRAVETSGTYAVESRLRAADGTYRWFLMRGMPQKNDAGKIVRWFGTCTDIEDFKRAEKEIRTLNRELEERVRNRTSELQTMLDTAPIGLAITDDPEARHIHGNLVIEQMLGAPQGGELSKGSGDCVPYRLFSDGRELAVEELPMQRAARGENVAAYEMDAVRADGQRTSMYVNAAPLFGQDHKTRGAIGAFVDISVRRQQELALQESEQRFRTLANSVPDLVWTCTPEGSCDFLNSRWVDYTGIPEPEQLGEKWLKQVHPEDRSSLIAEWTKSVASGATLDVEFRIRSREGQYRWFKTRAVALRDGQNRVVKWFGTNTDIEDLRRSQEALAAANKELEAFSYSVSHDLRAPLRHISGFSKILSEEFGPQLPQDAQHHLQRIQDGTRRMGELVDDLLNLSRVGRHEVRQEITSLENVVRQVLSDLQPECEGRDIQWNVGSLPFAECDAALVKQVFQNLLSNALKFTRPRKQAVIEVGCRQEAGVTVIFVRDNGVGFSMKYASKLFGVFQRMHRAEDFEGTGVGLATVQRIVQKHGGQVWAEAELDKGATFYFTLAASTAAHAHEEMAHAIAGD